MGMTGRIVLITIDAAEPRKVADFLAGHVVEDRRRKRWRGFCIVADDGTGMTVDVVPIPEPNVVKDRLHLDSCADGTTSAEELERLTALGARHIDIGQGPGTRWWVLSDPKGNEFCLFFRTVQEAEQPPARPVP